MASGSSTSIIDSIGSPPRTSSSSRGSTRTSLLPSEWISIRPPTGMRLTEERGLSLVGRKGLRLVEAVDEQAEDRGRCDSEGCDLGALLGAHDLGWRAPEGSHPKGNRHPRAPALSQSPSRVRVAQTRPQDCPARGRGPCGCLPWSHRAPWAQPIRGSITEPCTSVNRFSGDPGAGGSAVHGRIPSRWQQRRVQVVHVHGVAGDVVAEVIRLAVVWSRRGPRRRPSRGSRSAGGGRGHSSWGSGHPGCSRSAPNSPPQITSVSSSSPRRFRSVTSAADAWSVSLHWVRIAPGRLPC